MSWWLFLAQLFATLYMTGLIWFVQLVHYPMFADAAEAGDEHWKRFERTHLRRTTPLIPPIMLLEIATAALLLVDPTGSVSRAWAWAGAVLLAVVWASTFLGAVPMHAKLQRGFAEGPHRWLLRFNLVRSLAWTGRSFFALLMLMQASP
jgi:hypothetical protein